MAVFFGVRYPLKFKIFKDGKHMKWTYFVALLTVFMISGAVVAVQVSTGYATAFYGFGCLLLSNPDRTYSTVIIPKSLAMGISNSLLAVILWDLMRVSINCYLRSESKVCYKFI